jgi:2-oxo-4-hydroxy-4-carboxy-5-ureidoimidazoline decarboxylase
MELWQRLDRSGADEARKLLRRCCGSTRWVDRMLDRRPFGNQEALLAIAKTTWFDLTPDDWREAFAHHPKIGDREALRQRFPGTHHLSEREQAGVREASEDVLSSLAELNRAYEARFGFIFIVCATGLSAERMLAMLRARLGNDPATEVRMAAEEQAKITAIRLGHG